MKDTYPDEISTQRLAAYDDAFLLDLYERMVMIREFEEGVKFLFLEGTMPGTIHQCQGQEACAVGMCFALQQNDYIVSTFRGHGHALAKGLSMEEMLFELFGADTGCCRGKGGSMHIGNMDKGMVPSIAIVGGGIPLAAGMALAFKMQGTSQLAVSFFGDGATSEGAFHEGLTLASIWDLPAIFVCENNLYGASTHVSKITRLERLAEHAAAYGMHGETVDGNDVIAVYEAAQKAVKNARDGRPVLLELLTYRRTGHSRRDACHYQPQQEQNAWFHRDPIEVLGRGLVQRDGITADDLAQIKTRIIDQFDDAVAAAKQEPQPTIRELETDVFA